MQKNICFLSKFVCPSRVLIYIAIHELRIILNSQALPRVVYHKIRRSSISDLCNHL